jgi:cytochrome c oxidase subunit 1
MALLMRTTLAYPGASIVDNGTYNRLFSTHGTAMIFLFIIPVLIGFSNYFVPLLIGAKDMAYPRINALGYWMIPPAGTLILIGNAPVGWTGYVPLAIQEGASVNFWLAGLIIIGTSSIIGSVNFLVTIFKLRAPGVTFKNLSLFVWSVLTTQLMVLMATPVLAAALTMVLADRLLHTCFFSTFAACTSSGQALGDAVLYQHLFWFYSHPAVYIMILPSMGMISEVIPVMSRKPIFGYKAIAYSTVAIGLLGFTVWVHHMFTTGIDIWVRIPFMIATVTIAVPSGVKVFNWLATMWGGKILLSTPMLFAIAFLSMFVIGGISGVFQASIPVDYQLQDTYFVVAHLHYVLFGGSVMGLFAAVYFWFPTMTGRRYNERLGQLHFVLTLVGMNLAFFTQHFIGLSGMLRRTFDYTPELTYWPELSPLNFLSSVGAFLLAFGQLPFFYNVIVSKWRGPVAPADPWA